MKMTKIALAMGLAGLGISGMAQAELSANIGATSNYVWRGQTQTSDQAAISGGVDFSHDSGLYLGTWISNIDWGAAGSGEELDLYGGYSGEASGIGYDLGVIRYVYPSIGNSDFTELYGSVSYGPATVGLNYTVNGESGGQYDGGDLYYYASASFDLGEGWSVGGTVGHYTFDKVSSVDYSHAQLDVTKSAGDFGDFTLSLSNVFDQDVGAGYDNDLMPFVSWSKSF
ncbi:MAG: hypothetical protein D6720_10685 [Gammaproteobacteria bacterium]|nr:MAG: hypothetical protein D6720_10685 [Gammaproteobacteria bacterium]